MSIIREKFPSKNIIVAFTRGHVFARGEESLAGAVSVPDITRFHNMNQIKVDDNVID